MFRDGLNSLGFWRARPDQPRPGGLYQYGSRPKGKTAIVYLLGMNDTEVKAFLENSDRLMRRFGQVVFVVTCGDLSSFVRGRRIVEVLPDPALALMISRNRPWRTYVERRREVLRMKWHPDWALSYGWRFDEYAGMFDDIGELDFAREL